MKEVQRHKFNISVIGTGYVGLVTGACFSFLGHKVICVDNNKKKIEMLKKGKMPIYEPGLEDIVKIGRRKRRLFFTTSIREGVRNSQIIFIAVGTPSKGEGEADLSSVEFVSRKIAENLNTYKLIVEKSTVPVETGKKVKDTLLLYASRDAKFDVASNPEFLREGNAVEDFLHPQRIVIGVDSYKARDILLKLYEGFNCPILVTNIETAEIIKHACNSFLALKLSFINIVSRLCEKTGADVKLVSEGMGLDSRIGKEYLNAGLGFGGPCLEKDLQAFIRIFEKFNVDPCLLKDALQINTSQQEFFFKKIVDNLWVIKNKKLAVLGLSFKPNTDDMRNSPSIYIVNQLLKEKALIKVYDPQAMDNAQRIFRNKVKYARNCWEALKDSEAAIFLTEWEEFRKLDPKKMKSLMRHPIIFDARNIFDPQSMHREGFRYFCIGR